MKNCTLVFKRYVKKMYGGRERENPHIHNIGDETEMKGQLSTTAALVPEGSSKEHRTDGLLGFKAGLDSVTENTSTPDGTGTAVGQHVSSHFTVNKLS